MRLPKWMWRVIRSRRLWRILAIAPFVLIAGIALFFWIWSLVGSHAINSIGDDLAEGGIPASLHEYLVQGIEPEDDVFLHPAMLDEAALEDMTGPLLSQITMQGLASRKSRTEIDRAEAMDVAAWFDPPPRGGEQAAAEKLLKYFKGAVGHLGKISEAVERPQSSWKLASSGPAEIRYGFKGTSRLRHIAEFASQIAIMELAGNQAESAAGRVSLILEVERHLLESSPTDLSMLLADAVMSKAKQVIWEGIMRDSWSDGQLRMFDEKLSRFDPMVSLVAAQKGSLAYQWESMLAERGTPRPKREQDFTEGWEDIRARLNGLVWDYGPTGRWDYAAAETARITFEEGLREGGATRTRFRLGDLPRFEQLADSRSSLVYHWSGGSMVAPNPMTQAYYFLKRGIESALEVETDIALLRTGIAAERFARDHGTYPAQLADLTPRYLSDLPNDPWAQQALKWRLQADGTPHLWSIGEDRRDEDGLPHRIPNLGDEVWILSPLPGLTDQVYRRR